MKKTISILGSTGSIGLSTLKIIDKKKNLFSIDLLSAHKNYVSIVSQIRKYKPKVFVISNNRIFEKIKKKFKNKKKIIILNNFNQIKSKRKTDITVSAIPGLVGLQPTIKMLKISKKILIANKESIICGWSIIKKIALKNKTKIIPVDSEHFSILKLLENNNLNEIKKIYITASGGPFLEYKSHQFKKITPSQAIKHPKWKMGKKISVDSSTLMNKILEIIEAQKLFNIPSNKLDILIHPNSLVHAIVELKNGLSKFIFHETTMIIPLANAIFDNRLDIEEFIKLKKNRISAENKKLIFQKVDEKIFPVIKLKNRANEHTSTSIILNAANEILVDHFLSKKIPFLSISKIILGILNDRNYLKYAIKIPKNIDQIIEIDKWARNLTLSKIQL